MSGKNVTIGNVNISMSANAAELIRQVEQAEKSFKSHIQGMMKTSKKLSKQLKSLTPALGKVGAIAGAVGASGLAAMAASSYSAQREVQRLSDIAGVSMDTFVQMMHVTKSLGLETEYLADGMKDLNVRIADAAKGGGVMVDFFSVIGESAKEWVDLAPEKQLEKFMQVTSRMSDSDAKFWADEVNDSMYRLSVTLRRSGKSVGEFMTEAKELGAGTSTVFIGQINEMYNSFARLSLILRELRDSTFGILAESFGAAFDGMTNKLKAFLGEGENASESIFNMSKDIALYVLRMMDNIYTGIMSFTAKVRMALGEFDSSFTDGFLDSATRAELDAVNGRIERMKEIIEDGTSTSLGEWIMGEEKAPEQYIKIWEAKLKDLVAERDAILAGNDSSGFSAAMDQLITNVEKQTFAAAKAKAELNNNRGGKASSGVIDAGELKAALEVLRSYSLASSKATSSVEKQLLLEKEKLQTLMKHYSVLEKSGLLSVEMISTQEKAAEAIKRIDREIAAEKDAQRRKEREENIKAANEAMTLYEKQVSTRLAFDKKYGAEYQAMTQEQQLLEILRLTNLRQQGVINHQEMNEAIEQTTRDRVQSEIQMEMAKTAATLSGLTYFFGESEALAKAAFAFQHAMALQEVIQNQALAVSSAWADNTLPWYAKAGAAVVAAGAVGQQLNTIRQAGQFHDGGEIPYDGTYYMEGGEMVIPKDRVGDYIAATEKSGGKGGTVIESHINMGASLVDPKVMAAALSKQQGTIATLVNKEQKKRPARNRRRNN